MQTSGKACRNDAGSAASEPVPTLLKGVVCTQYVRCGKAKCRCKTGEAHGPYHYRVWREGTKVYKVYVAPEQVEAVRASCEAYRNYSERLRQIRKERAEISRALRAEWRTACRLSKSL